MVVANEEAVADDSVGILPGAVTLTDILNKEGYYQSLMVGSDASFGSRDMYYLQHKCDKIYDLFTAREDGIVPQDYYQWWGIEDKHLYRYAKKELLKISKSDKPFAFSMLTVDTHHVDGYFCSECENKHTEKYSNVISCASRQLKAFVDWIKEQDFYENTTIVICGDHRSMGSEYFERNVDPKYDRRMYNCIINPAVTPANSKNRTFTPMDMFPTTLAAMGFEIKGNRLALGVNLFSAEPTLAEKYGKSYIDSELQKTSTFYKVNFLQKRKG
jgi:phosphoglycerol transferase